MAGPIITGLLFSLFLIIFSWKKPNGARIFLGIFFIIMGLGINVPFLLIKPNFIAEYGQGAWFPLYRTLTDLIIKPYPYLFGILLICFEITMGVLLLGKKKSVKIGLIGTMLFIIMLSPLYKSQLAWTISIIGHIFLLKKEFNTSFIELIRKR